MKTGIVTTSKSARLLIASLCTVLGVVTVMASQYCWYEMQGSKCFATQDPSPSNSCEKLEALNYNKSCSLIAYQTQGRTQCTTREAWCYRNRTVFTLVNGACTTNVLTSGQANDLSATEAAMDGAYCGSNPPYCFLTSSEIPAQQRGARGCGWAGSLVRL